MVGVGLLIVLAVVGFRFWVLHTLKSAISAAPTSSTTSRIVRDAEAGLGGIRGPHTGSGVNVGALSNGTALQMAEVFRDSDVRRAVLAAVDSDDPAV